MNQMRNMLGFFNKRKRLMSWVALGVGLTAALGMTQRRRPGGGFWRQMLQPLRRLSRM